MTKSYNVFRKEFTSETKTIFNNIFLLHIAILCNISIVFTRHHIDVIHDVWVHAMNLPSNFINFVSYVNTCARINQTKQKIVVYMRRKFLMKGCLDVEECRIFSKFVKV